MNVNHLNAKTTVDYDASRFPPVILRYSEGSGRTVGGARSFAVSQDDARRLLSVFFVWVFTAIIFALFSQCALAAPNPPHDIEGTGNSNSMWVAHNVDAQHV